MIIWGNFVALGNVLTPIFGDQFTPTEISLVGVSFVLAGVIGCYIMGIFIDKTKKFIVAIRFIVILLTLLFSLALVIIPAGLLWLTIIGCFFAGLLCVPVLPATFPLACRLAPNVHPSVINGMMMSGAQLYSFVASLIID